MAEVTKSETFSSEISKEVEHMLELNIPGGIIKFLFEKWVLMRVIGFRCV